LMSKLTKSLGWLFQRLFCPVKEGIFAIILDEKPEIKIVSFGRSDNP